MHIKRLLLKQYNIPVIGHAKLSVSYSMLYINAFTHINTVIIVYTTTIDKHMYAKFGWSIGILAFMLLVGLFDLLLILSVRKFEQAGTMGADMDQKIEHSHRWQEFEGKIDKLLEMHTRPNRRLRKELRYATR